MDILDEEHSTETAGMVAALLQPSIVMKMDEETRISEK